MKVVLAVPHYPQPRGNTVTVQRISSGLKALGVQTEIISTTAQPPLLSLPEADLIHGFHAYQFYRFLEKLNTKPERYVVTMTGTDLNHDLFDSDKRPAILTCLYEAKAIHVFDEKAKQLLTKEVPELTDKIISIAQGNSNFGKTEWVSDKEDGTFLFLLPAGIRKVKNIQSAIAVLSRLHERYPHIRLWLAGPVLEETEGEAVMEQVRRNSDWIRYLGPVPHEKMGSLYGKADVVLNTSLTEGQPAAIIEAMGIGVPVIVSDNIGNSSIVTHEKNGFVYQTENEFLDYAERFVNNYELKQSIGREAKRYIDERHSGKAEAETLLAVYRSVLA